MYSYGVTGKTGTAEKMRFSIVIPSYNQARFLEKALRSILEQGWPDTEIIVIDGGSADGTQDILRKYQTSIAYAVSEKDKGQSDALNKGYLKATGDIFGWMNSDDFYLPETFSTVASIFTAHPDITVVYGNWISVDEHEKEIEKHYALKPRKPRFAYENIDSYNQAIFWRREAHERFGLFDVCLHRLMDNDFIIRLLKNESSSRFYRSDAFFGAFRIQPDQKTGIKMDEKHFSEEAYLEKKYAFTSGSRISGKWYRLVYRFTQLMQSLRSGGMKYTLKKAVSGYRKRGRVL